MVASHPTLAEQAAVAAWCPMDLLIVVSPDILLWVGLGEGSGSGRAMFRTELNPSSVTHSSRDPAGSLKPSAASVYPPKNGVL